MASKGGKAGTKLVIVESPAKAKTIGGYLGPEYVVEASIGHIRELPPNAASVPAAYKGLPWASLGVDVDNDFEALYVVSADRRQQVNKLKALVKLADTVLLATDEDREGEAIAWHLVQDPRPQGAGAPDGVPRDHPAGDRSGGRRLTPREVERAVWSMPRRTRRILDRLYGYEGQPGALEEGPAAALGRTRAVGGHQDRGRTRACPDARFRTAEYWDIAGSFSALSARRLRRLASRPSRLEPGHASMTCELPVGP